MHRSLRVARLAGSVLAASAFLAFAVGPLVLPFKALAVLSGSMEPTLPTGALAIVREVPATTLGPGDVITFGRPGDPRALVTHRVSRIVETPSGPAFATKGDANASEDPWTVPVQGQGLRLIGYLPAVGRVTTALRAPTARVLLVSIPALVLAALTLMQIWSPEEPEAVEA